MKCKECPANSEGTCLIKRKSRMLVSGSYGCDAQKKNVEKRLGIYKQTNADKIRHMTDEELAELLGNMSCRRCPIDCHGGLQNCTDIWVDWLREEANSEP